MNIVIAPDSFKESISATQAAEFIAKGIYKVMPDVKLVIIPMADGGEGTVDAMVLATGGKIIKSPSLDPLGREIEAFYGVLGNQTTAVIEMAAASGLGLLNQAERNPMLTSTFGTGLLMKNAIMQGYKDLVIGIGGSATNDGGVGMAMALGYKFLDKNRKEIGYGGGALRHLAYIEDSDVLPQLREVRIVAASDVKNPLYGPQGAAHVFAQQKGASKSMIVQLDENLQQLANITAHLYGWDISSSEGAGAAGGLGFGLIAFAHATIKPGFDVIAGVTGLEEHIKKANLVFTGEGRIDSQTTLGKTPYGIGLLAKKFGVPVIALAGIVGEHTDILHQFGISACFALADGPLSVEESIHNTGKLLQKKSEQLIRLIVNFGCK